MVIYDVGRFSESIISKDLRVSPVEPVWIYWDVIGPNRFIAVNSGNERYISFEILHQYDGIVRDRVIRRFPPLVNSIYEHLDFIDVGVVHFGRYSLINYVIFCDDPLMIGMLLHIHPGGDGDAYLSLDPEGEWYSINLIPVVFLGRNIYGTQTAFLPIGAAGRNRLNAFFLCDDAFNSGNYYIVGIRADKIFSLCGKKLKIYPSSKYPGTFDYIAIPADYVRIIPSSLNIDTSAGIRVRGLFIHGFRHYNYSPRLCYIDYDLNPSDVPICDIPNNMALRNLYIKNRCILLQISEFVGDRSRNQVRRLSSPSR